MAQKELLTAKSIKITEVQKLNHMVVANEFGTSATNTMVTALTGKRADLLECLGQITLHCIRVMRFNKISIKDIEMALGEKDTSRGGVPMTLKEQERILFERKQSHKPPNSGTVKLLEAGVPAIVRKFGEEAVEVTTEIAEKDRSALITELQDFIYFAILLSVAQDIPLQEVFKETKRQMTGGERYVRKR